MKKVSLLFSAIFLGLIAFLTLPSFVQELNAKAYNEYPCSAIPGAQCQSTGTACAGGFVDNYCPTQSNSIKCCIPTTSACYQQQYRGKCQTPGGTQGCGTSYNSSAGLCPARVGSYPAIQCCVGVPPPTNVTATCSSSGTSVTVTWTRPSGYTHSYARIHDETTNTQCSYSTFITNTSFSCNTAVPGHQYSYWVHTTDGDGLPFSYEVPTAHSQPFVTCPIPSATPTPTRTPTPSPTPPRFTQSITTPGIIFTGDQTFNFGARGQAASSTEGWVVGGLTYPETFATTTTISTISYQYLYNKARSSQVTINELTNSGCPTLTNCDLPNNLSRGVYRANGNLTLTADHNFAPGNNYVFLVNGSLTIQGNIDIPNSTTVLFVANQDIIIHETVGAPTNTFPLPDAQIQGLFSAGRNFIIQGDSNCISGPDKMLNIEGAIVTNANGAGGSIINQRDLCGLNLTIPSFTVRGRIDFLFNLPSFVMQQRTTFREAAP